MKQIGRYILTKKLGQGGMGVVYAAQDPLLDRYVAIKILPSHLLGSQTMRRRFMQEAQTIAKLQHPNIVKILDYGEYSPDQLSFQPYFVMEMLEGGSLEDRLRDENALPLSEVLRILDALAPAFDTAHGMGIVHRDVKPGNILFDRYDIPYLSDFGIARLTATSSITTIGTPDYMAPEQYTAKSGIDGRTDVYQLGVTIYQMVTGRLPFKTETPQQAMYQHLYVAPAPLHQIMPNLPPHWEMVINVALAKQPVNRYPTVTDLLVVLKNPPSLDTAFDIDLPENVLTRLDTIYPSSGTVAQYTIPDLDASSTDILSPPETPIIAKKTVPEPSPIEDASPKKPIVAQKITSEPPVNISSANVPSATPIVSKKTLPKSPADVMIEDAASFQEAPDDVLPAPKVLEIETSVDPTTTKRQFPIGMFGGIIGLLTLIFVVFFMLRTREPDVPTTSITTSTPSEVAVIIVDTPTATASPPVTLPVLLTSSAEKTIQAQRDAEATQRSSIATQSSATTRAEALLSQPECMAANDFNIMIDEPTYYPERGTTVTEVDIDARPSISYTVTIAGNCPIELLNIRTLKGGVTPQWMLLDSEANEVSQLEIGETGVIRLTFDTLNDVDGVDGEWRLNVANPDNQLLELSDSGQSLKLVTSSADPWLVDDPVVTSQPVATRVVVVPTANPSLSQANQKAMADVWNQRLTQTAQAAAANAQRVQATQTAQAAAANVQRFQATQTAQTATANAQRAQATQTAQAAAANAQRFQATQTAQAADAARNATQTAQAVVVPTATPTSIVSDDCNSGIPFEDSDEDGKTNQDEFIDGLDPCNPDSDGDGFLDGQDLCPTIAGPATGCPQE